MKEKKVGVSACDFRLRYDKERINFMEINMGDDVNKEPYAHI